MPEFTEPVPNLKDLTVACLGAGYMGSALIHGLLQKKILGPKKLVVADIALHKLTTLETTCKESYGYQLTLTEHNHEAVLNSQVVILAVKPHLLPELIHDLLNVPEVRQKILADPRSTLFISLAAGVSTKELLAYFQQAAAPFTTKELPLPLCRVMPNLPAMIGRGITTLTGGRYALPADLALTQALFTAVGEVMPLEENLFAAATGIAGCGPAYIFMLIEALGDAGVLHGLTRAEALKLATLMVRGSAELVLQSGTHPALLKDQVTSPGGATIAGLAALERGRLRAVLQEAVGAALKRTQELAKTTTNMDN